MIIGKKGNNYNDDGYIFSPYIPLIELGFNDAYFNDILIHKIKLEHRQKKLNKILNNIK